MKARQSIAAGALALALVGTGIGLAQPERNVNPARHPNLAAAQRMSNQAYEKVVAAQQANEWDLGGHAAKAKELLDEANKELAQAASVSNANHK
jgi:hypothetical protein